MDQEEKQYYGFYRAFVVENKDPDVQGRVKVWIPDVMPEVSQDKGLWARPANNPVGGRNTEYDQSHVYMGTSYIPQKGSFVFIFFEKGDLNFPWYFASCNLGNTKVLPENQVGNEKEHKWVVFKSHEGRCVVVSDDPDDRRVEITGKKRNLSNKPTGDTGSVYTVDGNQSTILFDEREGKEKILIRTHKGDYLHIDVDEQKLQAEFKESISLKTKKFSLQAEEIHQKSSKATYNHSEGDIYHKSGGKYAVESEDKMDLKAALDSKLGSDGGVSIKAASNASIDGSNTLIQNGTAVSPSSSKDSDPEDPEGKRDT